MSSDESLPSDFVVTDRRGGDRRGQADRRKRTIPVAVERRSGQDRRQMGERRRQVDPTTCERDYNDEEIIFMKSMDQYKRDNRRPFPTWSEVLEVLRALGYRMEKRPKPPEPATPPPVDADAVAAAAAAAGDASSQSGEASGDSAAEGSQDAAAHEARDGTTGTAEAAATADERSADAAPTSESSGPPTSEGIEATTDSGQLVTAQEPPAIIQTEAVEAQAAFGSGGPAAESVAEEETSGATSEPAPVAQSESTAAESPAQAADSVLLKPHRHVATAGHGSFMIGRCDFPG